MALTQLRFDVVLTEINCGCCGGTYAINERYREKQYQDGGSWTCPYCKVSWGYANDNENARLKKELEQTKRCVQFHQGNAASERAAREATERRLKAARGQQTKLRNRIKNGVCPCCTRSFQNLQRHIAHMHPEFQPESR